MKFKNWKMYVSYKKYVLHMFGQHCNGQKENLQKVDAHELHQHEQGILQRPFVDQTTPNTIEG